MSEKALAKCVATCRETYDTGLSALLSRIWGGHLHMGLFQSDDEPLIAAQVRANRLMADAAGLCRGQWVIEVACGIGSTARILAQTYGVRITATNITEAQLTEARTLTAAAGLDHMIDYAFADYHHLPFSADCFDVWWCQEGLLYSIDKRRVLEEATRTVRPGGALVLSDLLLSLSVSGSGRERFIAAIKAPAIWALEEWDALIADPPVKVLTRHDWSKHTFRTLEGVLLNLEAVAEEFAARIGEDAVAGTCERVTMQLAAARAGHLGWGVFVLRNRK